MLSYGDRESGITTGSPGSPGSDDPDGRFRADILRISVRLSEASKQLPEAVYLKNVHLESSAFIAGGAYADVRIGRYAGQLVALKTARKYMPNGTDATRILKVCDMYALLILCSISPISPPVVLPGDKPFAES